MPEGRSYHQSLDVANTFINLGLHNFMVPIYDNLQVRQRIFQHNREIDQLQ